MRNHCLGRYLLDRSASFDRISSSGFVCVFLRFRAILMVTARSQEGCIRTRPWPQFTSRWVIHILGHFTIVFSTTPSSPFSQAPPPHNVPNNNLVRIRSLDYCTHCLLHKGIYFCGFIRCSMPPKVTYLTSRWLSKGYIIYRYHLFIQLISFIKNHNYTTICFACKTRAF